MISSTFKQIYARHEVKIKKAIQQMQKIKQAFENYSNNIDIVFVMDTTGSMQPYLKQAKQKITLVITNNLQIFPEYDIKCGFVSYKDHGDVQVTKSYNLQNSFQLMQKINEISANGGDDIPQAVFDGLNAAATQMSWRQKQKRIVILIGDAPPHGKQYTDQKNDNFPNGCPCKLTINQIAAKFKQKRMSLIFQPVNDKLISVQKIFKKHFFHFQKLQLKCYQQFIKLNEQYLMNQLNRMNHFITILKKQYDDLYLAVLNYLEQQLQSIINEKQNNNYFKNLTVISDQINAFLLKIPVFEKMYKEMEPQQLLEEIKQEKINYKNKTSRQRNQMMMKLVKMDKQLKQLGQQTVMQNLDRLLNQKNITLEDLSRTQKK